MPAAGEHLLAHPAAVPAGPAQRGAASVSPKNLAVDGLPWMNTTTGQLPYPLSRTW
jgi:hypothetical protein